jgi:glycosyltransferase involved in cell wall biosynthesis
MNDSAEPLTFLIPVFNEESALPELFRQFDRFWREQRARLVFVNDGSGDRSLEILAGYQASAPLDVTVVDLSRNFGKDRAVQAGLSHVDPTSSLVLMDADGQHTVEAVDRLLAALRRPLDEAADRPPDVAFGIRDRSDYQRVGDRILSRAFYMSMNLGSTSGSATSRPIDDRIGDFFAARPNVVRALQTYQASRPAWKGYYAFMGFRVAHVPVEIDQRHAGRSKFNAGKRVSLALDSLTGFAAWPLRALLATGLVVLAGCLISAAWIVVRYLVTGETAEGFYTILLMVMFLGSLNLVAIGVVSEYLIGVITSANGLPNHLVREVLHNRSPLVADDELAGAAVHVDLSSHRRRGTSRERPVDNAPT